MPKTNSSDLIGRISKNVVKIRNNVQDFPSLDSIYCQLCSIEDLSQQTIISVLLSLTSNECNKTVSTQNMKNKILELLCDKINGLSNLLIEFISRSNMKFSQFKLLPGILQEVMRIEVAKIGHLHIFRKNIREFLAAIDKITSEELVMNMLLALKDLLAHPLKKQSAISSCTVDILDVSIGWYMHSNDDIFSIVITDVIKSTKVYWQDHSNFILEVFQRLLDDLVLASHKPIENATEIKKILKLLSHFIITVCSYCYMYQFFDVLDRTENLATLIVTLPLNTQSLHLLIPTVSKCFEKLIKCFSLDYQRMNRLYVLFEQFRALWEIFDKKPSPLTAANIFHVYQHIYDATSDERYLIHICSLDSFLSCFFAETEEKLIKILAGIISRIFLSTKRKVQKCFLSFLEKRIFSFSDICGHDGDFNPPLVFISAFNVVFQLHQLQFHVDDCIILLNLFQSNLLLNNEFWNSHIDHHQSTIKTICRLTYFLFEKLKNTSKSPDHFKNLLDDLFESMKKILANLSFPSSTRMLSLDWFCDLMKFDRSLVLENFQIQIDYVSLITSASHIEVEDNLVESLLQFYSVVFSSCKCHQLPVEKLLPNLVKILCWSDKARRATVLAIIANIPLHKLLLLWPVSRGSNSKFTLKHSPDRQIVPNLTEFVDALLTVENFTNLNDLSVKYFPECEKNLDLIHSFRQHSKDQLFTYFFDQNLSEKLISLLGCLSNNIKHYFDMPVSSEKYLKISILLQFIDLIERFSQAVENGFYDLESSQYGAVDCSRKMSQLFRSWIDKHRLSLLEICSKFGFTHFAYFHFSVLLQSGMPLMEFFQNFSSFHFLLNCLSQLKMSHLLEAINLQITHIPNLNALVTSYKLQAESKRELALDLLKNHLIYAISDEKNVSDSISGINLKILSKNQSSLQSSLFDSTLLSLFPNRITHLYETLFDCDNFDIWLEKVKNLSSSNKDNVCFDSSHFHSHYLSNWKELESKINKPETLEFSISFSPNDEGKEFQRSPGLISDHLLSSNFSLITQLNKFDKTNILFDFVNFDIEINENVIDFLKIHSSNGDWFFSQQFLIAWRLCSLASTMCHSSFDVKEIHQFCSPKILSLFVSQPFDTSLTTSYFSLLSLLCKNDKFKSNLEKSTDQLKGYMILHSFRHLSDFSSEKIHRIVSDIFPDLQLNSDVVNYLKSKNLFSLDLAGNFSHWLDLLFSSVSDDAFRLMDIMMPIEMRNSSVVNDEVFLKINENESAFKGRFTTEGTNSLSIDARIRYHYGFWLLSKSSSALLACQPSISRPGILDLTEVSGIDPKLLSTFHADAGLQKEIIKIFKSQTQILINPFNPSHYSDFSEVFNLDIRSAKIRVNEVKSMIGTKLIEILSPNFVSLVEILVERWSYNFYLHIDFQKRAIESFVLFLRWSKSSVSTHHTKAVHQACVKILHRLIIHNYTDFINQEIVEFILDIPVKSWRMFLPTLLAFQVQKDSSQSNHILRDCVNKLIIKILDVSPNSAILFIFHMFFSLKPNKSINFKDDENRVSAKYHSTLSSIMETISTQHADLCLEIIRFTGMMKSISSLGEEIWSHFLYSITKSMKTVCSFLENPISSLLSDAISEYPDVGRKIDLISHFLSPMQVQIQKLLQISSARAKKSLYERQFFDIIFPVASNLIDTFSMTKKPESINDLNFNEICSLLSDQLEKVCVCVNQHLQQKSKYTDTSRIVSLEDGHETIFRHLNLPIEQNIHLQNEGFASVMLVVSKFEKLCTKTRPKKIGLLLTNGNQIHFLVKGFENLKDDYYIMNLIRLACHSQISFEDSHSFYSIIPLDSTCGLVEWVDNVSPMYSYYLKHIEKVNKDFNKTTPKAHEIVSIISDENDQESINPHFSSPSVCRNPSSAFVKIASEKMRRMGVDEKVSKNRAKWPIEAVQYAFNSLLRVTPRNVIFNKLYLNSVDCRDFHAIQCRFIDCTTFMSIFGYIIGLGDRHLNNILIDPSTGGVTHVDFNLCFDAGKLLAIPELVPFRLTQNIENCLGPLGANGTFTSFGQQLLDKFVLNSDLFLDYMELFTVDSACIFQNYEPPSYRELLDNYHRDFTSELDVTKKQIDNNLPSLTEKSSYEYNKKSVILRIELELSNIKMGMPQTHSQFLLLTGSQASDELFREVCTNLRRFCDEVYQNCNEFKSLCNQVTVAVDPTIKTVSQEFSSTRKEDLCKFLKTFILASATSGMIPLCDNFIEIHDRFDYYTLNRVINRFESWSCWFRNQLALNRQDISRVQENIKTNSEKYDMIHRNFNEISVQLSEHCSTKIVIDFSRNRAIFSLCSIGKFILSLHKNFVDIYANKTNRWGNDIFSFDVFELVSQKIAAIENVIALCKYSTLSGSISDFSENSQSFLDFQSEFQKFFNNIHSAKRIVSTENVKTSEKIAFNVSQTIRKSLLTSSNVTQSLFNAFQTIRSDQNSFRIEMTSNNLDMVTKSDLEIVHRELAEIYLKCHSEVFLLKTQTESTCSRDEETDFEIILNRIDLLDHECFKLHSHWAKLSNIQAMDSKFEMTILIRKLHFILAISDELQSFSCKCLDDKIYENIDIFPTDAAQGIFFTRLTFSESIIRSIGKNYSEHLLKTINNWVEAFVNYLLKALIALICNECNESGIILKNPSLHNSGSLEFTCRRFKLITKRMNETFGKSAFLKEVAEIDHLVEKFVNSNQLSIYQRNSQVLMDALGEDINYQSDCYITLLILSKSYEKDAISGDESILSQMHLFRRSHSDSSDEIRSSVLNIITRVNSLYSSYHWLKVSRKIERIKRYVNKVESSSNLSIMEIRQKYCNTLHDFIIKFNTVKELFSQDPHTKELYLNSFACASEISSKMWKNVESSILKQPETSNLSLEIEIISHIINRIVKSISAVQNVLAADHSFSTRMLNIVREYESIDVNLVTFLRSMRQVLVSEPTERSSNLNILRKIWKKTADKLSSLPAVSAKTPKRHLDKSDECARRNQIKEYFKILLKQAKSTSNLCRMYEGWTSWV